MSMNGTIALPTTPPPPTLTSVVPNQGTQGTSVPVTLTGTNFVIGATSVNMSGSGVTINTIVVSSSTSLTANFVFDSAATTGARTVTVTTAGGTSGTQTFTVNLPSPGPPTLTSVSPNQGTQGTTVAVTLTGTNFVVGATTVAVSGAGVTVNSIVVSSSASLTANFVIDSGAANGTRQVTVTTSAGISGAQNFTVNLPIPPPPPGVITRANITYVGCFGLFDNPNDAGAMQTSRGGAAARIRPSDGKLVFFITREQGQNWPVYEVEDPLSYSTDYTTAPRSAGYPTARYVGVVRDSTHMKSWYDDGPQAGQERTGASYLPASLYWHEGNQLLYWTYYDLYNTSGFRDWSMGATSLDSYDSGTATYSITNYGPWRARCQDADGVMRYGLWRCLSVAPHPTTGKMMCGSTLISGNSGCPWGPDLYGGIDWPTASTPAGYGQPDLAVMPDRYLESYYMGGLISSDGYYTGALRSARRRLAPYVFENDGRLITLNIDPNNYGGLCSWTEVDSSSLGCWLQLTNTKGVIYFGNFCGSYTQDPTNRDAGHEWYQTGGNNCSHGHQPYIQSQGPASTHNIPFMAIYNPDDLEAVRNTANDYTPEPVDLIDLERDLNLPVRTADMDTGGYKNIGFVYWDATRNYLFAMSLYADGFYVPGNNNGALMHVFHIADVA